MCSPRVRAAGAALPHRVGGLERRLRPRGAERDVPITEANLFRPLSPYAVSKAAADLAAYQWSRAHALDVVRMRPFNHTGPGQDPQFVCADFARQLVAVERGQQPAQVEVGNLDVTRDFSDVRDVVRAYALAWQRGTAGEAYNVCSGVPRTTRDILDTLIRLSGVDARGRGAAPNASGGWTFRCSSAAPPSCAPRPAGRR